MTVQYGPVLRRVIVAFMLSILHILPVFAQTLPSGVKLHDWRVGPEENRKFFDMIRRIMTVGDLRDIDGVTKAIGAHYEASKLPDEIFVQMNFDDLKKSFPPGGMSVSYRIYSQRDGKFPTENFPNDFPPSPQEPIMVSMILMPLDKICIKLDDIRSEFSPLFTDEARDPGGLDLVDYYTIVNTTKLKIVLVARPSPWVIDCVFGFTINQFDQE